MTETDTYQVEDGWIELCYGTALYFGAEPLQIAEDIMLEEVAYSLSRLCRYNGHTRRHYSVAEHAIIMADWVAAQPWAGPRDVLTALHHDDAEYIIGDLARPIKVKMPQFKELETSLDRAVALRFGTIWPLPDWLKELDARMIRDERDAVMRPSANNWGTDVFEPLGVRFMPLRGRSPFMMRRMFVARHWHWSRLLERRSVY